MTRRSLLISGLVLLLTIAGAAVRLDRIHAIGLSHFDAGVYAQSGLWPWTGQFHFNQAFFSPPLFPILIGTINAIAGTPIDWAGPLVSALAGILLVPAGYWIAKDWFHERAGLMAATLLAFDPAQVLFSRVGLTDELFTLLFLVGFALTRSAVQRGGWRRLIVAGIVVGLAWNTKYHGFLAAGLGLACVPGSRDPVVRIGRLAWISGIALSFYLPWAISFHVEHGYLSLIEHQRGYFRGLPGWWEGARSGWSTWAIFGGTLVWLVPAAESAWALLRRSSVRPNLLLLLAGISAALMIFLPESSNLASLLLILPLALMGCCRPVMRQQDFSLLASFVVLLFLPGIYAPYARLWLPTETLLLILASGAWDRADSLTDQQIEKRRFPSIMAPVYLMLVISGIVFVTRMMGFVQQNDLYRSHAGYREVARESTADLADKRQILTLCRWPMNYYLALEGKNVQPLGDQAGISDLLRGNLLLYDQTASDTQSFHAVWDRLIEEGRDRFWEIDLDLLTRLDDVDQPTTRLESLFETGPKTRLFRHEP
ncbi:glycosyltransferase family 39 protein [bacterium]|nr:glycosyltransferase family 39 protein [bacterium]